MRTFPQEYKCYQCGGLFYVMQAEPGIDEDISACWDCIDFLFRGHDEAETGVAAEREADQEAAPGDRGDESGAGPAETSGK